MLGAEAHDFAAAVRWGGAAESESGQVELTESRPERGRAVLEHRDVIVARNFRRIVRRRGGERVLIRGRQKDAILAGCCDRNPLARERVLAHRGRLGPRVEHSRVYRALATKRRIGVVEVDELSTVGESRGVLRDRHGITISKDGSTYSKESESMTEARRQDLARLVDARGFVRVTDAAEELGVSDVTIRGDLSALERRGLLTRVHGGAMPVAVFREPTLEAALDRDAAAKGAIGAAAAALVTTGDNIYLDAGSTAMAVALALVERRELHEIVVVTGGLTIALALEAAVPRFTVIVTGGTLRPLQHSLVNPFAAPMFDTLRLDAAFIGCNGIHPVHGVTNLNLPDAEIKRMALRSSRRHVLIADASKLGRTDLAVIAPVDAFDTLVTAGGIPAGFDLERLPLDVRLAA